MRVRLPVDTAENGAVAVEKVSTAAPGSYDLVLMDVQMPVMDAIPPPGRSAHWATLHWQRSRSLP